MSKETTPSPGASELEAVLKKLFERMEYCPPGTIRLSPQAAAALKRYEENRLPEPPDRSAKIIGDLPGWVKDIQAKC
ncbi:MAG: hypothetical protein FJW30_09815 [Acidobacteria bacterium]|nr:hypothetical protein [Acidobacteriota bacterium]